MIDNSIQLSDKKNKKPFIIAYKEFWTNVQAMIFYPFQNIGPFIVAAMPALFTGHSVYTWYAETSTAWLAMLISCVVAVAMEAININVVHTSLDLFEQKQNGKGWLMVFFSIVVMGLVSTVIGFSESALSPLIKGLAVSSPWLTGIVYLAVGMAQSIHQEKQIVNLDAIDKRQQEAEQREFERQLRLKEIDQNHAVKLAEIEAETDRKKAEISDRKHDQFSGNGGKPEILAEINRNKKLQKAEILDQLPELVHSGLTNTQIGEIVGRNERTIREYRKELNGSLKR